MASWLESSESELSLAAAVAQEISEQAREVDARCQALEGLALSIAEPSAKCLMSGGTQRLVATLHAAFPALQDVDIQKPYPVWHADLTTNIFGRIAYELAWHTTDPANTGMVSTPPALALDMVALAAAVWLAGRTNRPTDWLFPFTFGEGHRVSPDAQLIADQLEEAVWYDPCIGAGIFPICILMLLSRLGVLRQETLSRIRGLDVEPILVTAARIRVALAFSSLAGEPYLDAMVHLNRSFQAGDSLRSFTEQKRIAEDGLPSERPPFDIAIGNPPYVRADRLSVSRKAYLRAAYPSLAGGSVDLYNYFIAHALLSLKPGGVLCYVSPASFQRSKYGRRTRKFIAEHGTLEALFDFDELAVFGGASVHASVYAISKSKPSKPVRVHAFQSLPVSLPLYNGMKQATMMPASNFDVDGWHFADPHTRNILDILRANSVPLIHYADQILSGIKTGNKGAYFLSHEGAQAFRADERTRRFIVPMLRPISIRAWLSEWDGTHLALIKKGEVVPPDSDLMGHLRHHETALRRRSDVQGHATWYGLRECRYYDLFALPKIVFPDIASECRFAVDTDGYYIPDGAFMIPKEDYFLLGLLNSCIGSFYFRTRCNSIGNPNKRGRLRFKKTYIRDFPVRRCTSTVSELCSEIAELARSFTDGLSAPDAQVRLDELVLRLYDVPTPYRDTIRGCS